MSQHSQETEVANGPLQDVDFEKQTQHSRETEETKETVPPVDTTENPIGEPLEKVESEFKYPNTQSLILIMLALYLSVFLVALDRTIIATAIPRITDEFDSLGDVGWYGSAYLLTSCAFQLSFGRIYTFYNPKWVFLSTIGLFEIGSAICGAAPNSKAFIIGRAIAGMGSSGIFSGAIIIMVHTVPLPKRPMYQGLIGAIFGVASVMGPLLGGAFTDDVTWRWCFYLNLPIGAATVVVLFFILQIPKQKKADTTLRQQILQLDPPGLAFLLPAIVCLLLALQWGGTTYAWNDGRIIALLVLFPVFTAVFIGIQIKRPNFATVPPRIIMQRSIAAGVWYSFCTGGALIVLVYYLPLWFQAIQGVSAVESGIRNLGVVLSLVVSSIFTGIMVSKIGYYTPFMYLSTILMSIGTGLLTTLKVNSGMNQWLGYQITYGLGIGFGMQQSGIAAQTSLPREDVSTGVSLMFFGQTLGGSVLVSVAQNVFANRLVAGLAGLTGLDPATVVNTGATELRNVVSPQNLGAVLVAYNAALSNAYTVGLAVVCAGSIGALAMEWRSVKGKQPGSLGGAPATNGKKASDQA